MKFIDNILNRITMYRLVLYYLFALLVIGIVFCAFGILPYNAIGMIATSLILTIACWFINELFAKIFRVPANVESAYITALILSLIISPIQLAPFDLNGLVFLLCAAVFAMASKYILAIYRKHIFNPAAIAVVLTAFLLGQYASWWVGGNVAMLAFVVIGGLLVVRKIQRFDLVLTFLVAGVASCIVTNLPFSPLAIAEKALIHTSMLFVGFVMLTEPLTTPPTRPLRILYGAIVGALFSPLIHFGSIYSTPELALVVGNLFSYAVSPKKKFALVLKSKTPIGADTYDFVFATGASAINFTPGQYMEFTLPIGHSGADNRGNRRYFTIASSPTEPELHLGIKFHTGAGASTFKKDMLSLKPGDKMMAGNLAGDFTLPYDDAKSHKKFVFIAGGIGITPFRSMVKCLSDEAREDAAQSRHDIVLLYANRTEHDIPYREVFDEAAETIGLKTIYITTGQKNRLDGALIMREIPDYRERLFYISGPRGMIEAFKKTLRELGVPRTQIKTDFFPGFA